MNGRPVMNESIILEKLAVVLEARKKTSPQASYAASLYHKGLAEILRKIDEEAGEVNDAACNGDNRHLTGEIADLWFHCMVLLAHKNIDVNEVFAELQRRFGTSGHEEKKQRRTV